MCWCLHRTRPLISPTSLAGWVSIVGHAVRTDHTDSEGGIGYSQVWKGNRNKPCEAKNDPDRAERRSTNQGLSTIHSHAGTAEPIRVSPPEAVVYLNRIILITKSYFPGS
jgi:hypothetical protein